MASTNRDFTLKRMNGADYDTLLPTTHMGQIYTNSSLTTTLNDYLNATFLNASSKGQASGVASLDAWGHVPSNQLGPYLAGGLKIQGNMSAANMDTVGELLGSLESIITLSAGASLRGDFVGYAWVATASFELTEGTLPANTAYSINPGDEGDTVVPISIEAGDILFVSKYEYVTTTHTWTLSVVNNTYGVATTASPGIVQLTASTGSSTVQDFAGLSSVVTGAGLANISTSGDSQDGALVNKIALMGHHHDNRYQPKDSDLTAIAALANADGNFIVGNGSSWTVESGATARASLGLIIGTHVQAYDAGLQSISGLTTSADKMIYTTGADAYAVTSLTTFARTLLDDTDASVARTTLGLTIGTNVQAHSDGLSAIAGLANNDGNFIVGNGSTWVAESGATARTSLSVYSIYEIDTLLTNRPTIFYDTTVGTSPGSLIIDID